jgi:putative aldouronate transport system substrate-binding protein
MKNIHMTDAKEDPSLRKPLVSLLLACALLAAFLPALSEESPQGAKSFILTGYVGDNTQQDMNNNLFFQRRKEKTGISMEFRQFTDYAAWTAEKARLFNGAELPDALFRAELSTQETLSYYQSGKLIDLGPLLAENAPNLYALLENNPAWREAITLPGGAIAALPAINPLRAQNAMWINKTWLERLKLDMPTDSASLRAVLEAFKTSDPNQNGRADEAPLTFLGPWDLKFLAHAFGLTANDYNMYLDASGTAQFMPATDKYREFVAWVSDLFGAGLLDKNGFTTADALRKVTDEKAAATYGIFFGPTPTTFLPATIGAEYAILPPLQYEGKQVYRNFLGPVARGTFAITSACKDPAALLQWVDYLYSEEGGILALLGQEGTEYAFNENGTWRWIPTAEELTAVVEAATLRDSDAYPMRNPVEFQLKFEDEKTVQLVRSLMELNQTATLPFPLVTLTTEQQQTVSSMQMEIGRFVDESLARFVIGETPLTDESWQNYLSKLDTMGLTSFTAFWQQSLGQAR